MKYILQLKKPVRERQREENKMAYCKIVPIKSDTHLHKVIDYISNDKKTDCKRLTDSFCCSYRHAADDFELERNKEVIKKGNNLAWHITQSFSPDDNITPEQALEIGKELMRRQYPYYQYIIAVHNDRSHIHCHIIMNSVNLKNHHKLHSNYKSLAEMQKTNDELCRENNLSVIEKSKISNKECLKNDIEMTLACSKSIVEFLYNMQQRGYLVKVGSQLSFKNKEMKNFISASALSFKYSKDMIEYRLSQNNEQTLTKSAAEHSHTESAASAPERKIWNDKPEYRVKRKRLMSEIDSAIKSSASFEEFTTAMQKRNYKVKRGKHLAFKNDDFTERYLRCDSLKNPHYTEAGIRFRTENKDLYDIIKKDKIERVISTKNKYGGLGAWVHGENTKRKIAASNWVVNNLTEGKDYGHNINYYCFMLHYNSHKTKINELRRQLTDYDNVLNDYSKGKNAVKEYFRLKPLVDSYKSISSDSISDEDKKLYKSQLGKLNAAIKEMNAFKEKYNTVSLNDIDSQIDHMQQLRNNILFELTKKEFELENLENIKYNYEASHLDGGLAVTLETAKAAVQKQLANEKGQKIQSKRLRI